MADAGRRNRRARRRTKDRVLQARIPEDLDQELRDRAEQLGLSVSTVVRNVLLHTFDLVEGVVTDSAQLARVIQGRETPVALQARDSADQAGEAVVIGWQEAILNRNGVCDHCNAILAKGDSAAIGVPVQVRPLLLCPACLEHLSQDDGATSGPARKREKSLPAPAAGRKKKPDD